MATINQSTFSDTKPPAYNAVVGQPSAQQQSQQPVLMQVPASPVSTPPVLGTQNPNYEGPEHFLALVIITTVVCAVLNVTSLAFGIVAIVMSTMTIFKKGAYDYPSAQRYSMMGVVLSICAIIWTGITTTITIGSVMGLICQRYNKYYDYTSYYYLSYYYDYNECS